MVDGEDVDGLVLVGDLPACAAEGGVPAFDGVDGADEREAGEGREGAEP